MYKDYNMTQLTYHWKLQFLSPQMICHDMSMKTINRFRVNPKVDALLESLFIQFHSQCLKHIHR